MSLTTASQTLGALADIVNPIPGAGTGLAILLKTASQVCLAAESAKANQEAYQQLAADIAAYTSAIAQAAQADFQAKNPQPDTSNSPDLEMEEVGKLKKVLEEVQEVIGNRQTEYDKRKGRPLSGLRQWRYDVFHKDEDAANIKALRAKVDSTRHSFQFAADVRGLGALQRIAKEMDDAAVRHSEQLDRAREAIEKAIQSEGDRREAQARDIAARQKDDLGLAENNIMAKVDAVGAQNDEQIKAAGNRHFQRLEQVEGNVLKEFGAAAARQDKHNAETKRSQENEFLKRELDPVLKARFDGSGTPLGCLPETREKLLEQLYDFTTDDSAGAADVFVLTGLAGTGKTTIAQSLCIYFDRQLPNASFFVSRNAAERRDPNRIIQTIVYQLSVGSRAVHSSVDGTLRNGRDITTRPLEEQVENLFTAPLKASESSMPRLLVVIDALDECFMIEEVEGGRLIPLIVEGIRQMSGRVRLLITSREEPTIMRMFAQLGLRSTIRLQKIEDTIVRADIERYYTHHFKLISKRERYPEGSWPSKDRFDFLVDRTKKLFVFAALVVRLLKDRRYDPKKRLEEILSSPSDKPEEVMFESLDQLYLDVLKKATEGEGGSVDQAIVTRVAKVIGALVLLQQPLTPIALSELLGDDSRNIDRVIQLLSAVLSIPDEESQPPTIFHPSFADFSILRCTDSRFKIEAPSFHGQLALRCLLLMNDRYLKDDICEIGDSSLMNAEVKGLEAKRNQHIPLELRYACEYWTVHLKNTKECSEELREAVEMFCSYHILHWIEVLSLIGKLSAGHTGLPGVIQWCKSRSIEACSQLLEDADRTLQLFDPALRVSALHVYYSALTLMPNCKLQDQVADQAPPSLRLKSERFGSWSPLRLALEGHTDPVTSVAFSADSTNIASASRDCTIQLWDSITGSKLINFEHTASATCVTLSNDGKRIASGSEDKTIRVWDTADGSIIAQLEGHADKVTSVHFSLDGTQIVSASHDQTIAVWNIATRQKSFSLKGHTGEVNCAVFTSDGKRVASGASDNTVRVWNVANRSSLATLIGHSGHVSVVRFSPDCARIASGSHDNTIRVWNVASKKSVFTFTGHDNRVTSVAFSPDGQSITSGSWDRTVQLWNATTGEILAKFEGHTNHVDSVAFSPDGTRIASGSSDKTIRVWATSAGSSRIRLQGHTDRVTSVAFSVDGKRIASGSNDYTVRVWGLENGRTFANLTGHTGIVTSVIFSPDGSRIASSAHDGTARMWDVTTGNEVFKLEGLGSSAPCIAFSSDGKQIATGSSDSIVRVFDASTGDILKELKGHSGTITSVAFSWDRKQVASAASDETVRLWDVSKGNELVKTELRSSQRVTTIEFFKEGRHPELRDEEQREMQWVLPDSLPDTNKHTRPDGKSDKKASIVSLASSRPRVEFDDGWLVVVEPAKSSRRRLCWVPADRRPQNGSYCWLQNRSVVFAHLSGILTIMNFS